MSYIHKDSLIFPSKEDFLRVSVIFAISNFPTRPVNTFVLLSENTPNIADPLMEFDVILSVKWYCMISIAPL